MIKNKERLSLYMDFSSTEIQLGRGVVNFINVFCKTCDVKMYEVRVVNLPSRLIQENFICYRCGVLKNDDQNKNGDVIN